MKQKCPWFCSISIISVRDLVILGTMRHPYNFKEMIWQFLVCSMFQIGSYRNFQCPGALLGYFSWSLIVFSRVSRGRGVGDGGSGPRPTRVPSWPENKRETARPHRKEWIAAQYMSVCVCVPLWILDLKHNLFAIRICVQVSYLFGAKVFVTWTSKFLRFQVAQAGVPQRSGSSGCFDN
jgi:hypothetical protein